MNLVRSQAIVPMGRRWAWPIIMLALSLSISNPAMAQQERLLRTLTVTGLGKESIATTLSQVQLGVEVQGKTAAEVQQEAARRSSAVVEFLQSRNVDKLQTTGVSLNPQYDYSGDRQRIIGYIATNSVSFRVPTGQAGEILDEAIQQGASRIEGVNFVAEDGAIEVARQQAIREAVQSAQTQANAALGILGFTQQEIVSIQIDGAAPPPPIFTQTAALRADAVMGAPPTPIIGGEQEVEASVTLQIRY